MQKELAPVREITGRKGAGFTRVQCRKNPRRNCVGPPAAGNASAVGKVMAARSRVCAGQSGESAGESRAQGDGSARAMRRITRAGRLCGQTGGLVRKPARQGGIPAGAEGKIAPRFSPVRRAILVVDALSVRKGAEGHMAFRAFALPPRIRLNRTAAVRALSMGAAFRAVALPPRIRLNRAAAVRALSMCAAFRAFALPPRIRLNRAAAVRALSMCVAFRAFALPPRIRLNRAGAVRALSMRARTRGGEHLSRRAAQLRRSIRSRASGARNRASPLRAAGRN